MTTDMECADCGRIAFTIHTDGKAYCWRCLEAVRDEEYEREIERDQ